MKDLLTDKQLQEILTDLKNKDTYIKRKFGYPELLMDADYRKTNKICVTSVADIIKILNQIDTSKDDKFYKIKSDIFIKKLFRFLEK